MRDAFEAWKLGIPAVVLIHEPFATLAQAQCESLGAKEPSVLVYSQDQPALESLEKSAEKANQAVEKLMKLLCSSP